MSCRTCNNCGWVHFGVTREFAETEVAKFNAYFDGLSGEKQQDYYGGRKSSIRQYEKCFFCGGSYENFRPFVDGDCPTGCTIQPIIYERTGR